MIEFFSHLPYLTITTWVNDFQPLKVYYTGHSSRPSSSPSNSNCFPCHRSSFNGIFIFPGCGRKKITPNFFFFCKMEIPRKKNSGLQRNEEEKKSELRIIVSNKRVGGAEMPKGDFAEEVCRTTAGGAEGFSPDWGIGM